MTGSAILGLTLLFQKKVPIFNAATYCYRRMERHQEDLDYLNNCDQSQSNCQSLQMHKGSILNQIRYQNEAYNYYEKELQQINIADTLIIGGFIAGSVAILAYKIANCCSVKREKDPST